VANISSPDLREQQWLTVILTPIFVSDNVITVSDTFGLHPKAAISLSLGLLQADFEIKRVLSNTQIVVGAIGTGIRGPFASPTQFNGGTLTQSEQNRNKFGSELVLRAVYQEEPASALRSLGVNQYGQPFSTSNPAPVNLWPASGIQLTLTALMLPNLVAMYTATLGTYDSVTSDTAGDQEILRFYNGVTFVGELTLSLTANGCVLNTGVSEDSFLLMENGNLFELEDGSGAILLE
jgi:hypothetical protein